MIETLIDFWSEFSQPQHLVGHCAYFLLILSMMMRSMNWLRFFAILAGSTSAVYYFILDDKVSMFWEGLFSLVNMMQLIILKIEGRRGRFSDEEEFFVRKCLPGVERINIKKLMQLGAWTEVHEDVTLIAQGERPDQLKFLVSGEARIERDGQVIDTSKSGGYLGEMSYLTNKPATATVITTKPTRFLAFDQEVLRDFLQKNQDVRHALEASFNRDLIDKLESRS